MNLRNVAVGFPQGRGVLECGLCREKRYHLRMIKVLLTAFALGLASLDFTGTLLALGALNAGARDRALVAFGCVFILGTAEFGSTLSLVIGPRIAGIDVGAIIPHD